MDYQEHAEDGFVIDTRERVEWALKKIGGWDDEIKRVTLQSAAIIARLEREKEQFLGRFQADLELFAKRELEGAKRRSYDTIYGTLALRKVPQSIGVTDKVAALEYAKLHRPEAVKVTESLDAREFTAWASETMQATGELIPGVEIKPERESFSIKFKEEKE